jgi:Protein of unknown function (DUF2802)
LITDAIGTVSATHWFDQSSVIKPAQVVAIRSSQRTADCNTGCEELTMPSLELTLSLARSITMVLAFLAAAWGFRHWRQAAERDAQRMFEQLDLIRAELMLLTEHVQSMELQAPPVQERPTPVEVRAPAVANAPAPRGYEVAARLARGGATCEELISSCGLSRHEAELLIRLNKAETARTKTAATPIPTLAKTNEERRARLAAVV